ncbi:hypothetical protein [Kosakonia sp.]|uniref:hypothetical protein n=1 Tax=Kosakonia sp. TaxID=1916651 RepID=UPI0028A2CC2D|nr:hypothetical protein [Kosakonia sp.]
MQRSRLMGEGYEPQVWQEGGRLTYSLPVESGFVSFDFTFEIQQPDLDVLLTDDYRRAVLEIVAHTLLQCASVRINFTQSDFDKLIADTLHASPEGLQALIARVSQDHHIGIEPYAQQIMARRCGLRR